MKQLESLTLDELMELKDDVEAAIEQKQVELRETARKEILAIAEAHGVSLDELRGTRKRPGNGKKRTGKSAPKYRNPDNASQTWTGRGKPPAWFTAAKQRGIGAEQLLIQ